MRLFICGSYANASDHAVFPVATIKSGKFLLGFGNIEITWVAWADNAPIVSIKITGRLLLYFFIPR
jgi:hypothetical protein